MFIYINKTILILIKEWLNCRCQNFLLLILNLMCLIFRVFAFGLLVKKRVDCKSPQLALTRPTQTIRPRLYVLYLPVEVCSFSHARFPIKSKLHKQIKNRMLSFQYPCSVSLLNDKCINITLRDVTNRSSQSVHHEGDKRYDFASCYLQV